MQVPIRKGGKYSNQKSDPNITQTKLDGLKKELTRLKASHPQAAVELRRLAEMGDFSENAAYAMAKGRLRRINQKILELEDAIKNAVIITSHKNSDSVQLGSKVTLETNGRQIIYTILGPTETDPSLGIISNKSPIGAALIGHRVGDIITIKSTTKSVIYKIIDLS